MVKKINFTINQLVSADLFLGYHVSNWNPRINYFLIGKYKGSNLFNLNHIYSNLKAITYFISELLSKKSRIWIINEKFTIFNRSVEFCKLAKSFPELIFFNDKWCKGLLSNYKYVNKVRPDKFPHAIIVPNLQNNHFVVNESFLVNIPSVSLVDSVDNPLNVFYPVPGNSKSIRSVFFFYLLISKSVLFARYTNAASFLFNSYSKARSFGFLKKSVIFFDFMKKYNNLGFRPYLLSENSYLVLVKSYFWKFLKSLKKSKRVRFLSSSFLITIHTLFFTNLLSLAFLKLNNKEHANCLKNSFFYKTVIGLTL